MRGVEEFKGWETREEVLAAVHAACFSLSDPQLARRHRAGLIPRPAVRSLGRGKGSVSLYPPGTGRKLTRILELTRGCESFENVAWRAWWEDGGELGPLVRQRLVQEAARWEAELSRLADLLAAEDAEESSAVIEMDDVYAAASSERMPTSLGRVRRNVGRERFATVFRVLAEVASGTFDGYPDEESELAVQRALRIDRARIDRLGNGEAWFEGSSAEDFRRLASAFGRRSLVDLAGADSEDLDRARRELRDFWKLFEVVAPIIIRVLGSEAFGLGTAAAVFAGQPEENQPFLVLMWLALREDPRLRAGMSELLAALPDALAAWDAFELIETLRAEIPAFARAISDESLGAALLSEEHGERLAAELTRLYRENRSEIDRFAARHPELASFSTAS